MSDNVQRRLLSLLVVATFVALQIPLKKLVRELVPGKRGPGEDVAEALVQGAARATAVILASTLVRGLADDGGSSTDRALQKDRSAEEGTIEVAADM